MQTQYPRGHKSSIGGITLTSTTFPGEQFSIVISNQQSALFMRIPSFLNRNKYTWKLGATLLHVDEASETCRSGHWTMIPVIASFLF